MDFNNIRHLAIIHVFIMLLIMFPLWYVMAYLPMRDNRKWHSGRGCATNFHCGVVSWTMLYALAYLGLPAISEGEVDFRGFFTLNVGVFILLGGAATCFCNRFIEQHARKYFNVLAGSNIIAGSGLLASGIFWLIGYQRPVRLENIFFTLSLVVMALAEISFLYFNKWKFRPEHLR